MNNVISIVNRMPLNEPNNLNETKYLSFADIEREVSLEADFFDYKKVSLIIPALNEEKSIGAVLQAIPQKLVGEIIVVDNGSSDKTVEFARRGGAIVVTENTRGYGAACLAGISSLSENCEIVAFVDADFSDFPEDLGQILKPIVDGQAEMVIGARTAIADSKKSFFDCRSIGYFKL